MTRTAGKANGLWWAAGVVLYSAACSAVVLRQTRSYEYIEFALRFALLLPVLWGALRSRSGPSWMAPPWWAVALIFAAGAAFVSWTISAGILITDESAYRFQARVFASGRLRAEPLPGATLHVRDTPVALYFEQHILTTRGWFIKYYPAWPFFLSLFERARVPWLANPFLSIALLGFTHGIGRRWFNEKVARMTVLLMALSPFLLATSIACMSDMFCAVLIAGAWFFLARWIEGRRAGDLLALFAFFSGAAFARPWTGAAAGVALFVAIAGLMKGNKRLLLRTFATGLVFAVLTLSALLSYHRWATGSLWTSPYAFSRSYTFPIELTSVPSEVLYNLIHFGRWGLQATAANVFPFVFFLALGEWWRRRTDSHAWALGLILPTLFVAHLFMRDADALVNGERYYLEGFFGCAMLAAAALDRISLTRRVAGAMIAVQLVALVVSVQSLHRIARPFIAVRKAADKLPLEQAVVFLSPGPGYVPKLFNPNDADWRRSRLIFLVDPGPSQRTEFTRLLGRPRYAVISFDKGLGAQILDVK